MENEKVIKLLKTLSLQTPYLIASWNRSKKCFVCQLNFFDIQSFATTVYQKLKIKNYKQNCMEMYDTHLVIPWNCRESLQVGSSRPRTEKIVD